MRTLRCISNDCGLMVVTQGVDEYERGVVAKYDVDEIKIVKPFKGNYQVIVVSRWITLVY